jgi:hypothetical protein
MSVAIEIEGIPGAKKMVEGLTGRQMQNRMRRAVRAGGKVMQGTLKAAAATEPTGNVPASFKKVRAPKVSASLRRGGDIVSSVKPDSPLYNIFEPGAGGHEIGGGAAFRPGSGGRTRKVRGGRRTGGRLAGPAGGRTWDDGGRKRPGAFFARGEVHHPGMAARPLRPTAFAAGEGPARDAIARVLFEETT